MLEDLATARMWRELRQRILGELLWVQGQMHSFLSLSFDLRTHKKLCCTFVLDLLKGCLFSSF